MTGQSFDAESKIGLLEERVTNQGAQITNLQTSMQRGFAAVDSSLDRNATDTRTALANLAAEFRSSSKPQWQALSLLATVIIFVLGSIGTLVWVPIKGELSRLSDSAVTRADLDYRLKVAGDRRDDQARAGEVRDTESARRMERVMDTIVPRAELENRAAAVATRFTETQRMFDRLDERLRQLELGGRRPPP